LFGTHKKRPESHTLRLWGLADCLRYCAGPIPEGASIGGAGIAVVELFLPAASLSAHGIALRPTLFERTLTCHGENVHVKVRTEE